MAAHPAPDALQDPTPAALSGAAPVLLVAMATFLGAFLLFFLEPLIARFVLPWFGGSAGVWTTCLLFFQICLLAGYAYAHALTRWLPLRLQIVVHVVLLLGALLVLPITPGTEWKPRPTAAPVPHLLRLLTVGIGLPFLMLAATGPLLQTWFSRLRPGQSPYRLYALSNAGSLLALLSHPFVFEPWLPRTTQATVWGWAFGLFALLHLAVGFALWRAAAGTAAPGDRAVAPTEVSRGAIPLGTRLLWLALPRRLRQPVPPAEVRHRARMTREGVNGSPREGEARPGLSDQRGGGPRGLPQAFRPPACSRN